MKKPSSKSPASRPKAPPSMACIRSAIGNGKLFGGEVDRRSASARRLKDVISDLVSDAGGEGNVSEGERLLIRRIAVLVVQAEALEMRWELQEAAPSAAEIELYGRITGNVRRALETISRGGLPRRMRDVDQPLSIEQYERLVNGEAQP